jgi:hypothetical protein
MVLGVHWLESLSPILWDFSRRTMAFMRNGHRVTWTALDTVMPSPAPLFTATDDIMEALLEKFETLFATPCGLLLVRARPPHSATVEYDAHRDMPLPIRAHQ